MTLDASSLQGQLVDPIYDALKKNDTLVQVFLVDRIEGSDINASTLINFCESLCQVDETGATQKSHSSPEHPPGSGFTRTKPFVEATANAPFAGRE